MVIEIPIDLTTNPGSILVAAIINGTPTPLVLDTGDAVGPVFNAADAATLNLVPGDPLDVTGAGGTASGIVATTATVQLGDQEWSDEPCAIDPNLQGPSLLGLPFFLALDAMLLFDFQGSRLVVMA
jgi:predicted aspartyl protease